MSLWHFVLRNAWETADLEPWGDDGIEHAARWGGQPGAFVAALRDAGYLDGSVAHGWMNRAGSLVMDRLRKKTERSKKVRGLSGESPGTPEATVPYRTVPYPTLPTSLGAASAPKDSAFHSFMDGVLKSYWNLEPGKDAPAARAQVSAAYKRHGRAAKDILAMAGGDPSRARKGADAIIARMAKGNLSCNLDTVARHFLDWNVDPEAYERETKTGR